MSDIFPITKMSENKLINTKGVESYFYKIDSPDIEQMSDCEMDNFYKSVSTSLNHLGSDYFYKFYHFEGENYLNSNAKKLDLGLSLEKSQDALELFFVGRELYSNLDFFDDYLNFNGIYQRVISITSFSEDEIDYGAIPEGVDYIISFKRLNPTNSLKKLERIRSAHGSALSKVKTDFQSSGAYDQAEELIREITHNTESLFEMELYFLPKAESLEDLNELTLELISDLSASGMTPFIEGNSPRNFKSGLSSIYSSLIPGVAPRFSSRVLPNKTTHLRYLLPLSKSKLMPSGSEFFDSSGRSIYMDFFNDSLKNRNILVTGSTGGGKSVLVNKIVFNLAQKHPTVVLDKGGSFKKLCLYFDGYNLESKINPMDFRGPYYLREFILSVVDKESFNKLKRGLLLKEIKSYLDQSDSSDFNKLLDHLEKTFSGINLYFEDIKEFITTESIPNKNFLYVDIEKFPKSQISPLIIYVLEYFKSISETQKILVFDECYSFLKGHEEYLDESFRQIRKSGAMAIAIAQGYKDFSTSNRELYSSFTNNTFFKFFFMQDMISHPDITDFDNDRVQNLEYRKGEYSECYLKSQDGKYKKVMRIFLTDLEYELFHTEVLRNDLFYKFYLDNREYFETNSKTIESFVRLHHENN